MTCFCAGGGGAGRAGSKLQKTAKEALTLLNLLSGEQGVYDCKPAITSRALEKCDALVFVWSFRAGVGVGFSQGGGFVLRKLGGEWSAPLFVKLSSAQAGAVVGAEKVSTIMLSATPKLAQELESGSSHSVLGGNLSLQLLPQMQDGSYDVSGLGSSDLLSVSISSGMMLDFSLSGGSLKADAARNAETYGKEAGAADILSGTVPPPPELQPLYDRLAAIRSGVALRGSGKWSVARWLSRKARAGAPVAAG